MSGVGRSMKKDCFASGALSSSSLKGTFTKIRQKKAKPHRKSQPRKKEDIESDCELCRCSSSPNVGSSRTVRRILTACVISLLALLGSVSVDLGPSLQVWRDTEAALNELTSCKSVLILGLIRELQSDQDSCNATSPGACQHLSTNIIPRISHLCHTLDLEVNVSGQLCAEDQKEICQTLLLVLPTVLNGTGEKEDSDTNVTGTAFSLTISELLDLWGDPELDIWRVRFNPDWADVLSLKLLLRFQVAARNTRESFSPLPNQHLVNSWYHAVSHLSFAMLVSENLQSCWLEKGNVSQHATGLRKPPILLPLWTSFGMSSVSHTDAVIYTLGDVQNCLLDRARQTLKKKSRDFISTVSLKLCLLSIACLIYPIVLLSFKQMTEWIENYARSLKERTEDLKQERRLAEDLLHQMLPKSVAKQLRQQKHVEAESYEKVTIFFSDIVGFTAISASCTPLQVVEMLNNLYMCFDTRIDSYDVYKVETIGDAYMVVSGLPERNGDRHADEIAKMSLDLVAAVRQVPIPHMPSKRLQLRAGIHTGPCVAGIVGYKMPRYCLFGDTVNTASRMESTSLPQKVHVSSATYLALKKDDAYELQLRGEIEVKGKGKMNTYWLVGHKNYSVQNDSLVCHWNPNLSRNKKGGDGSNASVEQSNTSITVWSISENTTPVSMVDYSPNGRPLPEPAHTTAPESPLCVSALVEQPPGTPGTLGSMTGGLQSCSSEGASPRLWTSNGTAFSTQGGKTDLLPGSVHQE
ncbi:uncharacterized protein [Lepisosteus oculatus]|uniref:guanylate cyclase n=1 Tax=Lepisosteus oculatus TaxID=7918 RepID=W5ME36_LEPOC|nr:PREDICTED: uncharacterized protein LOC102688208 isoform X1 [Lepisosteus oculatus]